MPAKTLDPEWATHALKTFGYTSVGIDTPKAVVDEFASEHGCSVEKHFFHWVLKPLDAVAETTADREAHWEKVRQDNLAKRQKNAANRKKKESQDT